MKHFLSELLHSAAGAGCRSVFVSKDSLWCQWLDEGNDVSAPAWHCASQVSSAATGAWAAAAEGRKTLLLTAGDELPACGSMVRRARLAEVPLVLAQMQFIGDRDAPLPGDVDVLLARQMATGVVPPPILVATNVKSVSMLTQAAFNLAERWRMPVILLISFRKTASSPQSPSSENFSAKKRSESEAVPSWSHVTTIDKTIDDILHDPARLEAVLHRHRAQQHDHQAEMEMTRIDPDPEAQTLLVSYGLADEAAQQAVKQVRAVGGRVSYLTLYSLWPMPESALRRGVTPFVNRVLVPEINLSLYAEELSRILRGVKIEPLSRFDGELLDPEVIARRITHWPCG